MAYVLIIFMAHGFHGPAPVEFYGKAACEAAKVEVEKLEAASYNNYGIKAVLCLPKSAATK